MAFKLEGPNPGLWNSAKDLFPLESAHATSIKNPSDLPYRRHVLALILKAEQSCNLNPKLIYLAINYIDRYLHNKDFPQHLPIPLVAAACLSLAAKTLGFPAFSAANLKEEDGFARFNEPTLGMAEQEVTAGMGGEARSITPFAFLRFLADFFPSIPMKDTDALRARATEIIIRVQREYVGTLECKASGIAASALFCAVNELFPMKFSAFRRALLSRQLLDKDGLEKCYDVMIAAAAAAGGSSSRADKKRPIDGGSDDGAANKERRTDDGF